MIAVPDSFLLTRLDLKRGWFPNQPSFGLKSVSELTDLCLSEDRVPPIRGDHHHFSHYRTILNCHFWRGILYNLYSPFSDAPLCPGSGTSPSFDLLEGWDMVPAMNTMQDANVKDNLGRRKNSWQLSDSFLTGPPSVIEWLLCPLEVVEQPTV